ncbi:hypothetical protein H5993_05705 [Lactobacillus alvi]|uniref:Uncharacterized protein n=1 Tax=Limosilactobacillus alvi TaxID=990412 RepID=A0ABS2EPB4_9LACO|nr:hypothetical protein [Limosilactobacillus alvi]MBM6754248.1 hypothetical protein [Limosilactobacillus alvi]
MAVASLAVAPADSALHGLTNAKEVGWLAPNNPTRPLRKPFSILSYLYFFQKN